MYDAYAVSMFNTLLIRFFFVEIVANNKLGKRKLNVAKKKTRINSDKILGLFVTFFSPGMMVFLQSWHLEEYSLE